MKSIRLRKRLICTIIIVLLGTIILALAITPSRINVLAHMQDGTSDHETLALYSDYIDADKDIVRSRTEIWYYNCDLNDDGNKDKIVMIFGGGWGGSAGEQLDIWNGDGEGDYTCAGGSLARLVIHRYDEGDYVKTIVADRIDPEKKIFISDNITNGYKDLEFVFPGNHFVMQYDIDLKLYVRAQT